jgi:metal-sulfur cluster biosynthetic enzyme
VDETHESVMETAERVTETAESVTETAESAIAPTADGSGANGGDGTAVSEEQVLEALKHVVDPELGINIVDLGLVYEVDISQEGVVHVEYTLTTMGCPIGPLIEQQMQSLMANVAGVKGFDAEMVLRPPWSPEMMSEEAKAALGYF